MVIEVKKGYTELKFTQNENFNGEEQLAKFYQTEDKVSYVNDWYSVCQLQD